MKNKLNFKINKKFIKFLILPIIFIIIYHQIIINTNANNIIYNNKLIIDSPNEIYEGTNFSISVYTLINNTPQYQIDVRIYFNNKSYNITSNQPEIIIESPKINNDTYFKIIAIKTGFINEEKYIMILNNLNENKSNLIITILDNDFIVQGNNYFSILVTNEKGIPISNTTVGIQNFFSKDSIDSTDEKGRARLFAPNNCDEIIILAQKKGYLDATEMIWINRNPNILEKILHNPYTLILFSFIILLIAIITVSKRKNKKYNYQKNNNIISGKEKPNHTNKKNNHNSKELNAIKEAKVEEIRINKKKPAQQIVNLKNKKEDNHSKSKYNKKINRTGEWFEGIDDIRYKIDKITGDIDAINENKWFEGEENIRNKIDEKLKKIKK